MPGENRIWKIKIFKNGPYQVTGGVPLTEKIITPVGNAYVFTEGRKLPQAESYLLCRCESQKSTVL
jgi:CDGSH-type Zn-finger protein